MLTLFTTAKPFRGHSAVIQQNALRSWTLLHRDIEVILFGDDEGAAATARELGLRHVPQVERNEYGTKRLDYMFAKAQTIARHRLLCYINCDIILMNDFCLAVERARAERKEFLMAGRRWDLDITEPINFAEPNWSERLSTLAREKGKQRTPDWIDYFVFSRALYPGVLPPFVIGRVFWDNWLLWKARESGNPVIDASRVVRAVHQNHDYGYHPQGYSGVWFGDESGQNYRLAGGWRHLRTIADATHLLYAEGLSANTMRHWATLKRYLRQACRVLQFDCWHPIWFLLLDTTRPLRRALGLRTVKLRPLS